MNNHIKFAADLGYLAARAKFAAEMEVRSPEEEEKKKGIWDSIPPEYQMLLSGLGGAGLGAAGMAGYSHLTGQDPINQISGLFGKGQTPPPPGGPPPVVPPAGAPPVGM